jgi:hypothetical protein
MEYGFNNASFFEAVLILRLSVYKNEEHSENGEMKHIKSPKHPDPEGVKYLS